MKNNYIHTLHIILFLTITSCNNQDVDRKHVTVSLLPQKHMVSNLLPSDFKITTMVTKGYSPATYSPTPNQIKNLNTSFLYLQIGNIGFEQAWIDKFSDINPQLKLENTSEGINFIREDDFVHGDHIHKGGIDPHIWTSPKTMKKLLFNTTKILTSQIPELEKEILQNSKRLEKELNSLDSLYKETLRPYKGQSFIIFHPAYTYLARDYGIQQISIEHKGKEPSAKWLSEIIQTIKNQNIKAIFVQEEFDKRNAEIIAKELNIEIIEVHPLKENYEQEMMTLLNNLVKALNK